MSMEELWHEALSHTEIIQLPIKRLVTFGVSHMDYIALSESVVNTGDTVVRKGKIDIDKPSLVLPKNMPTFEGFTTPDNTKVTDKALSDFFYVRGISFPSLSYTNEIVELDVYEGSLAQAEKHYQAEIRMKEQITTGMVIGKDTSWQFSVILLACTMIESQISADLRAIIEHLKRTN